MKKSSLIPGLNRLFMAIACLPVLLMWLGCTTKAHRKNADDDVYEIVEQVEKQLFGRSSEFNIDAQFSDRDPDEITYEEIFAERDRDVQLTISIDEALDFSIKNSREYQAEKEKLYLTALTLTGDEYAFSSKFFAGATGTRDRFPNGERSESLESDLGVGKLLRTGTNVSVSIANDILQYLTGDPRKTAISTLRFSVFQPLLRGANREVIAERLTQAERNVIYSVRDYSHFQNKYATDIVIDYFRLLERKASIFNAYNDYQSRTVTTQYLRARSVDREKALAVNQSEQAQLAARNRYINSIVSYRNTLDKFKITLGLPQTVDLRLQDVAMVDLKEVGPIIYDLESEEGFSIAVSQRLPLQNSIDRFEDLQRKVRIAADDLKTELNLTGLVTLDSDKPTDYDQFDSDKVRTSLGLTLDLPIDRLRERNSYRVSLIRFEAGIRNLSRTLDDLRSLVDSSLRELDRLKQNYEIQTNAVRLAEIQVSGALLSIESGKVIFRDLEEAQDDLIQAQNAQTAALVDYLEARLKLLLDLGILDAETNQFWLTEATQYPLKKDTSTESSTSSTTLENNVITPEELFPN